VAQIICNKSNPFFNTISINTGAVAKVGMQETKSGYKREVTFYECDSCLDCPFKKKCTKAKQNRKLQVSKKFIAQRAASLEKITSEKGILLRMNRSIQSEGAFGVIKHDYNFRQFLLRGNRKVTAEIMLVADAAPVSPITRQNRKHGRAMRAPTGCL